MNQNLIISIVIGQQYAQCSLHEFIFQMLFPALAIHH